MTLCRLMRFLNFEKIFTINSPNDVLAKLFRTNFRISILDYYNSGVIILFFDLVF